MAARGRTFSGSVKESDYLHDFPCFPCEKDGRNVEAIKHCADCAENLCSTCLTLHNRFAMTRGHKVLDQVQASKGLTKQLPSQRCSKHGGKIIDVFCPEHDTVGCSTCISVNHSSCKGKTFIPDIADGIKTSNELKQLETDMVTLKSKLDLLKKREEDNLKRIRQDKDSLKKEIQLVRKKMNEQLDTMEKDLLLEADAKFKQKIDAIHASIAEVDDMLARVKQATNQVKSDVNDADIFVSCKILRQEMSKEIYPLHAQVDERLLERSFELHIDKDSKLILEGKRILASIKEKYTIQSADYKEDINLCISDDKKKVCNVKAMCALPDGCLVMADYNNTKLKKFDPLSSNICTLVNLPDIPTGLCPVDNTRLAVCLINQKKIQFVSLSGKVTLDKRFSVGDRCRGLAHCNGLLYVCCGGSPMPDHEEGRGRVEVYNCAGELHYCMYKGFSSPQYISVMNDGFNTKMYTADYYEGVQIRGIDGAVKHRYPTDLNIQSPFCLIGTDQLVIGQFSTGAIYIQTYKDKRILVEKDVMQGRPVCLYFHERSSRLFVALRNCDVLKVFDLSYE